MKKLYAYHSTSCKVTAKETDHQIMAKVYMVEYDEIAYSVNIVSHFLVTYGAYCEFLDDFYSIKCIPMVYIYMWDGF